MKKFILLLFLSPLMIQAQKVHTFNESQFLKYDKLTDTYQTKGRTKRNNIVKLHVLTQTKKKDTTSISITQRCLDSLKCLDTTYHVGTKKVTNRALFLANNPDLQNYIKRRQNAAGLKKFGYTFSWFVPKRLYGEIVQEKDKLKFYPRSFDIDQPNQAKWDLANNAIQAAKGYDLEIPKGKTVKVKYSAYHVGAITLPMKIYTNQVDSISNFQFDANLNFMFGRKWGRKKYGYAAKKAEDQVSVGSSINVLLGVSELTVSPANTRGEITKEISTGVISYGFAYGLQIKGAGIFVATGMDSPLSKFAKKWAYRDTVWFGFGLGLDF